MSRFRAVLMYGMGGAAIEWWNTGERALKPRLEAIGGEVILINWDERQTAYNFMSAFPGPRLYFGDSLGALSAVQYPGDVKGKVEFAGAFQPSYWDSRTNWSGWATCAANLRVAHSVYNPSGIQTLWLGRGRIKAAPGSVTAVFNTPHYAPHPDDFGWAQDLLYSHAKGLLP